MGDQGKAGPGASATVGMEQIDPQDPAFFVREDFHEVLARLRAEDPVHTGADRASGPSPATRTSVT